MRGKSRCLNMREYLWNRLDTKDLFVFCSVLFLLCFSLNFTLYFTATKPWCTCTVKKSEKLCLYINELIILQHCNMKGFFLIRIILPCYFESCSKNKYYRNWSVIYLFLSLKLKFYVNFHCVKSSTLICFEVKANNDFCNLF